MQKEISEEEIRDIIKSDEKELFSKLKELERLFISKTSKKEFDTLECMIIHLTMTRTKMLMKKHTINKIINITNEFVKFLIMACLVIIIILLFKRI